MSAVAEEGAFFIYQSLFFKHSGIWPQHLTYPYAVLQDSKHTESSSVDNYEVSPISSSKTPEYSKLYQKADFHF